MITYGFFNSVNGDRVYNADSFNNFFEGLISSYGVFEGVAGAFKVSPASGLKVQIDTGKAIINNCWVKNDAVETVTLQPAHNTFGRYDAIKLILDTGTRDIQLQVVTGTPASFPTKPNITRVDPIYEIVLAYVYVGANETEITAYDIDDCRYVDGYCGIITGLIDHIDTTTLYQKYESEFLMQYKFLQAWQSTQETNFEQWQNSQQQAFQQWFESLTEQLNVNTYIERYSTTIYTTQDDTHYIDIPNDVNYENGDILDVFIGGVLFVKDVDYTIETNAETNKPMVNITYNLDADQPVTFYNYKSKIGYIAN